MGRVLPPKCRPFTFAEGGSERTGTGAFAVRRDGFLLMGMGYSRPPSKGPEGNRNGSLRGAPRQVQRFYSGPSRMGWFYSWYIAVPFGVNRFSARGKGLGATFHMCMVYPNGTQQRRLSA